MRRLVYQGDILDIQADVLICSANVFLNLSGGVGGAFLLRYGPAMQEALHNHLAERGIRHLNRGDVIQMPPCGSPYQAVLHAIAVDGVYETSPEIIASTLRESLNQAARLSAQVVALTAIGTGYGRMSMAGFAQAIRSIMRDDFTPIEQIVLGLRSPDDVGELMNLIPELDRKQIV